MHVYMYAAYEIQKRIMIFKVPIWKLYVLFLTEHTSLQSH